MNSRAPSIMKNKLAIFFICAVVLGATAFLIYIYIPSNNSNGAILKENTPPLSLVAYRAAIAKYISIVADQNPRIALAAFRQEIKNNPSFARDCHTIAHEIGRSAYEKYNDFGLAAQYQDEICNSGYIHGVVEGYLSSKTGTISEKMRDACALYVTSTISTLVQCYHGLGHAFMYATSNDLPRSLELCKSLKNFILEDVCTTGAFMENFNTDTERSGHITQYENPQNPFYPCPEESPENKKNCYLYAPTYFLRLHNDNYFDAFAWCVGAEQGYAMACAGGVGYRAMNENIDNPMLVEKICDGAPVDMGHACMFAATIIYIDHGSLDPTKNFCDRLELRNQSECLRAVHFMQSLSRAKWAG